MARASKDAGTSKRGIIVDIICLCLVAVALWIEKAYIPLTIRGFFCDDDSIRYPHNPETITGDMLHYISFSAPAAAFLVIETAFCFVDSSSKNFRAVLASLMFRLCEVYGCFLMGACAQEFTVDVGKNTVGRLRPHFLVKCQLKEDVCAAVSDPHTYITDYECMSNTRQSRVSFPSGHSSLSFYTAGYVAIYLYYRLNSPTVRFPRFILQAGFLIGAFFIALSRIHDYMHHPTDIAAGTFIGLFWAFITAIYVIDMRTFSRSRGEQTIASDNDSNYYDFKNT